MIESTKKRNYAVQKFFLIILLLGPALFLFTMMVIVPVVQAGFFSFFRWKGGPFLENSEFKDFQNFGNLFKDPIFLRAVLNNVQIVIFSLLFQLPAAFAFALLVGRKKFFGSAVFRVFYFFPYILTEIVVGIIWKFIYHPEVGLPTFFYQLFTGATGFESQIALLGNGSTAFFAIFIVIFWKYIGFHMILYIAGLQNVPKDLEEAAEIDGASKLKVLWHVILPCMRGSIIISVFLSVIGSFNVFDVVWAMGKGGPVNATETLVTYLYNFGLGSNRYGYGSAVAVVIFLICLVFNIVYQKFVVGENQK